MFIRVFAIVALVLLGCSWANNVSKETLYVLSQLPYPVPNSAGQLPTWTEGVNVRLALNLAARQINKEPDLLPNHKLELVHINGGCDYIDVTVASFTEAVTTLAATKGKRFVGVIGPGCSRSTFGLGSLVNRPDFNVVTIHGAGASVFSNRTTYPYFFGSLGSVEGFGELAVALMRKTNWRKIAILFHDARLFYDTMKKEIVSAITDEFSNAGIVYSSMVRLDNFLPLDEILHSRARIIFVVTPPEHSRQIMCLAYHMGMIYPAYQWVIASRTVDSFNNDVSFTYNDITYRCSADDFKVALNNSFFMNYRLKPFNDEKSVANLTYDEYSELYEEEVETYNSDETNPFRNLSTTVWAAYFYDSLWALAIALHNVTLKYNVSLSDYQYEDENITKLIAEELYNVNLVGNSGPVQYSQDTGFLVREIDLTQVIDFREEFTAYSNAGHIIKVRSFDFIKDEFEIDDSEAAQGVAALFGLIASIQLLVVIASHILTIVYRNRKSIKASSPNINHIAFVGIYMLWIALMLNSISVHPTLSDQASAAFCQTLWTWLLPVSFTLSLGPVVVRTWRLYRIFNHYLNPGPFISNPVLITVICIMVAVDLIIAIIWTSTDPFKIVEVESTAVEDGATTIIIQLRCRCDYYFVWLGTIMIYKLATLVVLCVLALLTRNIKNQSFTTASLRIFGYIMTINFALGFSVYYLLLFAGYSVTIDFTVLCLILNLMFLAFTACVFTPPLIQPLREKFKMYTIGKFKTKDVSKSDAAICTGVKNKTFETNIAVL